MTHKHNWKYTRQTDKVFIDACDCGKERHRPKPPGLFLRAPRKIRRTTAHKSRIKNMGG